FKAFVVFFTLFFLFRDGISIRRSITALLPLTNAQSARLVSRINETIIASVYGGIAVGFSQGLLTGVAFWLLSLPSPALWGTVAALASLSKEYRAELERAVAEAVADVLLEGVQQHSGCTVVIANARFDEVGSSEAAFMKAAKFAMRSLLANK